MDYPNKKTRPRIMDILEAEQASDASVGAPASQPGERPRIMNLLEDSLKPKDRTLMSTAGDFAVTGAKAVVGVGESLVGLADLIPGITPSGRPSYGIAGKAFESLGWDPKKTHEILETLYSPKQQAANLRVQQAEGFVNSVIESIKNPSTILNATLESLPVMFGGAGIARLGLTKAPLLLKAYPKLAPLVAGAMGEGLVSMGMAAEQNRQETPDGYLTAKQAAINVASGFGTGAIALAGGRLAMKLGITDVDTLLAGGRFNVGPKGIIKRILGGGLSEGVFEELPQSMQEQIWANAALDRPLLQGVGEAGAQGMLAGGLMGAGAGIVPHKPGLKEVTDPKKKKSFGANLKDQLNAWSKSKETDPLGDDDVAKDIIETLSAPLTQPPEIPPDEAGGAGGAPDIAQLSAFEALQRILEGKSGRLVKQKYKWRTNKEPAAGEPFMILGDQRDPAATITKHTGPNGKSIYNAFVRTPDGLESIGLFSTPEQASTFAQDELESQTEQGEPQYDAGAMQPQTDEFAEPLAAFAAGLEGEPITPEPLAKEEEVPPGEAPPRIPPTVDELRAEKERRIDKYRQRKASNATTLRSFLNAMGGLNPNDPVFKGEFEDIRWDVSQKGKKVLAKGFPRGFWNKKGRTLDTYVTDVIESGWLPAGSTDEDLLNAITNDLRIKHTQVESTIQPQVDDREQRLADELEDEARAAEPPPPLEEHPPEVTPDFDTLVKKAQAWKGATLAAHRLYDKEDKKAWLQHSRMTTKGDMDAFLMKEYNLAASTARSVSNQLTSDNLPPLDENINLEDYKGEPWADAALNYKKPEPEYQPRSGVKATPSHDLAFMKEHKTKEQLDKMYQDQVKQIEGRMEPDQTKRAKMMSRLKSAYKIESEKYPKTDKTGLPQTNDGRLFVSGLNNKQLASLAQSAGFSKERIGRLDLESHRSNLVVSIQELEDKGLLDSSVIGGKQATKPAKAAQDKEPWQMKLEEFEKAGYRPADVTMSQWVNIMRNHRRDIGQSTPSGTPASPYADYEEHWKRDVEAAKPKKPEKAPKADVKTAIARDIEAAKAKLLKQANRKGISENFGQKEVRDLEDKHDLVALMSGTLEERKMGEMINDFRDWTEIYIPEPKKPEKAEVEVADDWRKNIIKARGYARRLGINAEKGIGEHWTDLEALVEGIDNYLTPSKAPEMKDKEAWEMPRDVFQYSQNKPIVDEIQKAITSGQNIVLATQYKAIKLTKPEYIRIAKNGTVQIPEGKRWVSLTDAQVEALGAQAGVKPTPIVEKVFHRAEVEKALSEGKPVPDAVLAEYPDLAPNIPQQSDKTDTLIKKAKDYVSKIWNSNKREYANKYFEYLLSGRQGEEPKHALSPMAAQAVRLSLGEFLDGIVKAPTPIVGKPTPEPKPKKASEMTAAEMMAEWDKQVAELAESSIEPVTAPPTAKQKAEESKQHLQNALDKFKQINAILDKKGAVGPELDQGTWEQILPLLKEAFAEILSAGKSGAEFVSLSIQNLSSKGRPYFEKFVNEEMKAKPAVEPVRTFEGAAYRVESGQILTGKTAQDVVTYEATELENKEIGAQAAATGIDLTQYSAKDIVWVTRTKEDALRYADGDMEAVSEYELPHGSRIIATDGGGGYLVLKQKAKPVVTEVTEPWALTQDQYMEGDVRTQRREAAFADVELAAKPIRGALNTIGFWKEGESLEAALIRKAGQKSVFFKDKTRRGTKDTGTGLQELSTNKWSEPFKNKEAAEEFRKAALVYIRGLNATWFEKGEDFDSPNILTPAKHEALVLKAYQAGKPVPASVLANYPDMVQELAWIEPLTGGKAAPAVKAESNVDKILRAEGALNKHFFLDDIVDYLADRANKGEHFIKFVKGKQTIVPIRTAGNAIMKMDGMRTYRPVAFGEYYNKLPEWIRLTGEAWLRTKGIDPDATVAKEPETSAPKSELVGDMKDRSHNQWREATIAETKDLMMTELMAHGDTAVYKAHANTLRALEAQRNKRFNLTASLPVKPGKEALIGTQPFDLKGGPSDQVAEWVFNKLNQAQTITWRELFSETDKAYGGTQAQGTYSVKDAYDAMEIGINRMISKNAHLIDPSNQSIESARSAIQVLKKYLERIPTQTKRTEETDEFQQFSTPPPLAFMAAWVANLEPSESVLEPSGGTGNIATMAKNAGAKVTINELSERRFNLLGLLGFNQYFKEDAGQINNILPSSVKPTTVLMNPPFTATAGRLKRGSRSVVVGQRHVAEAAARLEPGGRLVAIMGQNMAPDTGAYTIWALRMAGKGFAIRANISVSGQEYKKYGTTWDNQLIILDKVDTIYDIITGKVNTIEELLPLVEGLRNDRADKGKRASGEPESEGAVSPGEAGAGQQRPVLPATGVLVDTGGVNQTGVRGPDDLPGGTPLSGEPRQGDLFSPGGWREQPGTRNEPGKEPERRGVGGTGATPRPDDTILRGISQADPSSVTEELDIRIKEKEQQGELTDEIYEGYRPEKMIMKGVKPHPTPLVQSAAMSAINPPDPTYKPKLPVKSITSGKLSDIQLEAVVYAGQAHKQLLPDDSRMGFFIGDGTGVGKGREIAAIMWDNWNRGRKKAIWLSEKESLFKDAQRDFNQVGWSSNKLFNHSATPATDKDNQGNKISSHIRADEGVLFSTYSKLGAPRKADDLTTRFDQIVEWAGKDFDGVIAFDEAHNMGNSLDDTSGRFGKKASLQALAGVELQARLPKARIVYTSATGATEVMNLAYAARLGLWGEGTAFSDVRDFVDKISSGGIAAMELVATDMKAMGLYISRSLSYDGVEQDTLVHNLSTNQINSYNKLVEGWQVVLNNIRAALIATGAIDDHSGSTVSSASVSSAMSAFWGANQRFFNQVITSMQTPTLLKNIRKDLAAGRAPVVQLTSTFEASTTRNLARLREDQTLEDLDLTPRDGLMQLVQGAFPVAQIETYYDDHGNRQSRVATDSLGNIILNAEAVAMREKLLDEIGSIAVPQGPLDMILDEFGTDMVAEVTGRTKRVINKITEKGTQRVVETWSRVKSTNDVELFMSDKKKILVFSEAGGTGRSYHSDLSSKNQKKRIHYLLQPGWRADKAIQGLGRTHRSNQTSPPKYFLVTTDLKGQKRFVATIARRLDQLGALTKGQRETGSSGLFDARDNLESIYAENALRVLFNDLAQHNVRSITIEDFENQTGLKLINPTTGGLNSNLPTMRQFLNRLLSLKYETQNQFFDEFMMRMDSIVSAHIAAGTLDQGLETLKAEKIEKISEETVRTDERTGAETKYVQLNVTKKTAIQTFSEAKSYEARFIQNKKSGKVWQVKRVVLTDRLGGNAEWYYVLKGEQYQSQRYKETEFPMDRWDQLTEAVAQPLWQAQVAAAPKLHVDKYHLMTGTLLPVWDRLVGHPRIFRIQTEAGERMIGRLIPQRDLSVTLKNVGAEATKIEITPEQIFDKVLDQDQTITFANNWNLKRRLVSGDERIEITGLEYNQFQVLESKGAFSERIQYRTRFFIPTEKATGARIIKSILTNNPVVSIEGGATVDYRLSKSAATTQETENLQKISADIKGWLAKAGIDQEVMYKVDVALPATIPAQGQKGTALGSTTISQTTSIAHTKALIQLAVSVQDLKSLEQTAYHEAFHLAVAWILPRNEIAQLIRHFGTEEAAADAFMEYMYKRSTIFKVPSPIRRLLMKIQRTLQIVRNGLKGLGFNRPEDIFGQLSVGVYKPHFKGKPGTRYQVGAWHGGPHSFDKFTTDKIGAGEGAKAFGWGLYFSDLKDIGERYAGLGLGYKAFMFDGVVSKSIYNSLTPSQRHVLKVLADEGEKAAIAAAKGFRSDLAKSDIKGDWVHSKNMESLRADIESGKIKVDPSRNLYKVTLHKGKKPGEYSWLHWYKEPTPDLLKKAGMERPPFPVWSAKHIIGFHDYWDLDGHGYVIENTDTGWFDYYPRNNFTGSARTLEFAKKEVENAVNVETKFKTGSELYYALGSKLYSQANAEADQYFEDLRRKYKIGQRDSVLENLSDQERAKMDALNDKAAMDPDQLASLFLLSQGIDGVKYPTGTLSQYNPFSQEQRRALASQIYKKDPSLPNLVERIMSNDNNYETIERLLTKNFGESEAKRMIDASGAKPTFNYVVFDESAITIDEHTQFRVRPEEDEADHEKSWTAATMLSLKEFGTAFINSKAGFVKSKEDTTVIDRLISTPSHYFNKVPAAQRMYESALRFPDNQQSYVNAITKSKMNGDYFTTRLEKLNKDLPGEYTALKDYLVSRDMDQVGFSVKKDDSGKFYTVLDPKGVTVGRVVSENGAWTLAITEEAKRYREKGSTEQAAQALIGFRAMMHNGFNILYTNIRETIARLEALDIPLPEVAVWSGGGKVQVNLKQALQMMGDLRGYYFPRQRAPGRYMVTGEKKDGARFMDFRDMKSTAQSLVNKLTLKGYDASYSKSPALPEDVFEMARSTVAIQAEINAALGRIKQKGGVTLEDFGLKRVEFITDTMKASFANYDISLTDSDFLVTGPWNKDMTPVFKAMGGKWYRAERVWHFYNPPKNFEKRLSSALMQKVNIVDRQMAVLFAKNLTEQAANVLKARGHRVHMIQRVMAKGQEVWKGYETDPTKSAANYASGLAAGESKRILAVDLVAAMTGTDYTWQQYKQDRYEFEEKPDYSEYLKVIEKRRIDPATQKNAFRDAKVYMEDLLRNTEWIDRFIGGVKGLAVLKYLGGRVSAPIVNLTAMVTSVPACMNGFANISPGAIAPLLTKAASHYTRYKLGQKTGIPNDVIKALDFITDKGWDTSQYNREALSVLEGKLKGTWRKLMEYSMMAFGASEQLNRGSTILGTFMGIKAQGGDYSFTKAIALAKRVSDQAHGVYGKTNYPFMARGSNPAAQLIKSFYVFRTFSHNYLLTMKDLWGHSWKPEHAMAFNYMLISPAIVAGTGATVATPIIAALLKMAGLGGDDPEEALYDWVLANLGDYAEEFTRFGLFGMAGVSLKGSLQIGITDIPTTIPEVLGAPGSVITDLAYGAQSIIRGDVSKGFEKILPLFAGNVLKAIRESTEGVTSRGNAPVFYGKEPLVADTIDAILRSMSFNPSRIAAIREKVWSETKIEIKYREMRSDIYAKFKRFYLASKENRSKADYIDLLSEVRQYNARVLDRGLTAKGIPLITKQSIKNNLKRAFRPAKRERLRKTG